MFALAIALAVVWHYCYAWCLGSYQHRSTPGKVPAPHSHLVCCRRRQRLRRGNARDFFQELQGLGGVGFGDRVPDGAFVVEDFVVIAANESFVAKEVDFVEVGFRQVLQAVPE